jgi:hypothetical protein
MPTLYHFELTNNNIYEVVAMGFRDACLTLEEMHPEISIHDILCISEFPNPIPGIDTIH